VARVDPSWWPDHLLPWLHSPLGAVAFVPLYALWVTLVLPVESTVARTSGPATAPWEPTAMVIATASNSAASGGGFRGITPL
jgi:hypothetical protein